MKSQRVDTWVMSIADQPGALATKLKALAAGGVNLDFLIARRAESGKSVVFAAPITGGQQIAAAGVAGFQKTSSLHTVRVEGANKPGQGAKVTEALASAGLNLRGFSAAAIGGQFVCYIALDTEADATKAMSALQEL